MRISIFLCSLGLLAACQRHPQEKSVAPEPDSHQPGQPTPTPGPSPTAQPKSPCDGGEEGYAWVDAREDKDGDSSGSEDITQLCVKGDVDAELKSQGYVRVKADEVIDQCDNNKLLTSPQELVWDRDHDRYASDDAGLSCDGPNADQIIKSKKLGADDCDQIQFKYKMLKVFRDADRDKFGSAESASICIGSEGSNDAALVGYVIDESNSRVVDECDDIPSKYRYVNVLDDKDHDGYGRGPAQAVCIGALATRDQNLVDKVLVEQNQGKDDCDDVPEKFLMLKGYQDKDQDGWSVGQERSVCVDSRNAADPVFAGLVASSERHGQDCNDDEKTLNKVKFVWKDRDGDSVGAGAVTLLCSVQNDQDLLSLGWSSFGYDSNDDDASVAEDEDEIIAFLLLGG